MENTIFTIIPAAGFGTRLLPGSKSIPKEMFPIVDSPSIEYIAKEVKDAGLSNLIIVTAKDKDSIVDYFDRNFELEHLLKSKNKTSLLKKINRCNSLNIVTIRQKEQRGLGHAVHVGNKIIKDQPFIVSLPDMLIKNGGYHLKNMVNIFKETGKGVIALMRVPKEETFKYGIANVSVPDSSSKHLLINDMVEKPDPNDAPSDLAIVGRYVLPNKTMFLLDSTQPGAGGEIQLTDAIKQIANSDGMIGYIVEDEIHDMGNPLGFIKANISFGLDDPEIGDKLREYILNQMK